MRRASSPTMRDNSAISCESMAANGLRLPLRFVRRPRAKRLLHFGVRKERQAQIAQHRAFDNAVHVRVASDFLGVDMDLKHKTGSVGNRCPVYHAVELR